MPAPEPLPDCRQTTAHSCATAAWRTVYKYHVGRNARVVDLSHPISGTDPATLEAVIRHDNKWNILAGNMTLDDLRGLADSWRPVIVLVTFPNETDSHYCVVGGVWRGKVYLQCPLDGWFTMRDDDFLNCWHGLGKHSEFKSWGLCPWPCV